MPVIRGFGALAATESVFLALTKRQADSGDGNELHHATDLTVVYSPKMFRWT